MTTWNMRPLGVQILVLGYRTGEAWNETAYSNPDFDKKLGEALSHRRRREAQGADGGDRDRSSRIRASSSSLTGARSTTTRAGYVKNHGMHPTFEHEFGKVWLDKELDQFTLAERGVLPLSAFAMARKPGVRI